MVNAGVIPKKIQYLFKGRFNQRFVRDYGLETGEDLKPPSVGADSNPNVVVWLRNIDRLLSISGHSAEKSSFLDLGAGAGIAMLYVAVQHPFVSLKGVEIQAELVKIAEGNFSRLSSPPPALTRITQMDAANYQIEQSKTFVFAFNPFGARTMRRFMQNNIETLKATSSIVLLSNDHLLKTTLEFGHLIKRDSERRLSAVAFKG